MDARHRSLALTYSLPTKDVSLERLRGVFFFRRLTVYVIDTEGRICSSGCCLPCPLTQWVYPDYFDTMTAVADWIAVVSTICCIFLLLSWACLPVEKTNRHYLSICLTTAVIFMNVSRRGNLHDTCLDGKQNPNPNALLPIDGIYHPPCLQAD